MWTLESRRVPRACRAHRSIRRGVFPAPLRRIPKGIITAWDRIAGARQNRRAATENRGSVACLSLYDTGLRARTQSAEKVKSGIGACIVGGRPRLIRPPVQRWLSRNALARYALLDCNCLRLVNLEEQASRPTLQENVQLSAIAAVFLES